MEEFLTLLFNKTLSHIKELDSKNKLLEYNIFKFNEYNYLFNAILMCPNCFEMPDIQYINSYVGKNDMEW